MSRGDNQLPRICFDDEFRVRVLEKETIAHTQELEQESNQFATKLEEFHDIIKGVLEVLEGQAKRIEREKLKAIGQRNRVDSEVENRNRQKQMLESLIKEKQTELERYDLQHQSLTKIADEQQALIDKLSNNEA
uniref:Intraflagellar transport protein 20 n=1 Tax=Globisporangium ultimum (strain ATCC 200006 / CBS 805.95 / DAOM BR144) TaxID=431595 RepID=K3XDM9_GLOUD